MLVVIVIDVAGGAMGVNAPVMLSGAPEDSFLPMWSHHNEFAWDT